jgi:hypothetical protein
MGLPAKFCLIHRNKLEKRNGVVGDEVVMELMESWIVESPLSTPTLQSIVQGHYSCDTRL